MQVLRGRLSPTIREGGGSPEQDPGWRILASGIPVQRTRHWSGSMIPLDRTVDLRCIFLVHTPGPVFSFVGFWIFPLLSYRMTGFLKVGFFSRCCGLPCTLSPKFFHGTFFLLFMKAGFFEKFPAGQKKPARCSLSSRDVF